MSLVKEVCKDTGSIAVRDNCVKRLDIHRVKETFSITEVELVCSVCFVYLTYVCMWQTKGAVISSRNEAMFSVGQLVDPDYQACGS